MKQAISTVFCTQDMPSHLSGGNVCAAGTQEMSGSQRIQSSFILAMPAQT
jgi:hypothetical protein